MKYGPHVFLLQNGICHPVILLLTKTTTILDKKQPPRCCKNSRMTRGTNNCGWLMRDRKENCGKPLRDCVGGEEGGFPKLPKKRKNTDS